MLQRTSDGRTRRAGVSWENWRRWRRTSSSLALRAYFDYGAITRHPRPSGLQGSMTEDDVSLLDHAQHCRAMPCSPNCRTCPRQLGGVPLVCLAPPRRGAFTIWRRGQLIIGWTPSVDFDSDSERKGTEDRQKSFRSPHSLTHGLFLMHSIWP